MNLWIKIYVSHRGAITIIKPNGQKEDILTGLPGWTDDNYSFFHDFPGSNIVLQGQNFKAKNYFSSYHSSFAPTGDLFIAGSTYNNRRETNTQTVEKRLNSSLLARFVRSWDEQEVYSSIKWELSLLWQVTVLNDLLMSCSCLVMKCISLILAFSFRKDYHRVILACCEKIRLKRMTLISTHNQLYNRQKIVSDRNNCILADGGMAGPNNGNWKMNKTVRIPLSNEIAPARIMLSLLFHRW